MKRAPRKVYLEPVATWREMLLGTLIWVAAIYGLIRLISWVTR